MTSRALMLVSISCSLSAVVGGCHDEPAAIGGAPVVTRRDAEPAGANCADGGTAIRVGRDLDGDGVLDDSEVEHTDYVCGAAPVSLVREDPIAAGDVCPAGGTSVHSGIDRNGDGVLQDSEIVTTTVVCDRSEIWEGDFDGDWSDPATVAKLVGVRVVTGSLTIDAAEAVDLPALEHVIGNLDVSGSMPTLGALRAVGGDARIAAGSATTIALPALERVGGDLSIDGTLISGDKLTHLELPALTTAGSVRVTQRPALLAIDLTSLTETGTLRLSVVPKLTTLSVPSLTEVANVLEISGASSLATLELGALRTVGGALYIDDAPVLVAIHVPALTDVGVPGDRTAIAIGETGMVDLDLSAIVSTGDISIIGNPGLHSVSLQSLTSHSGLILSSNALTGEPQAALVSVSAPQVTELAYLVIADSDALTTLRFDQLTTIRGDLNLSSTGLVSLAGLPALARAGSVVLEHMPKLVDLRGTQLRESVGELRISDDAVLTSTAGLELITNVSGRLTLKMNPKLTSVAGFSGLTHIGENLFMEGNFALPDLSGLDHLYSITGALTISSNPALTSLAGLGSLSIVGGDFDVSHDGAVSPDEIAALAHRVGH